LFLTNYLQEDFLGTINCNSKENWRKSSWDSKNTCSCYCI